jgi:hypothetical protein
LSIPLPQLLNEIVDTVGDVSFVCKHRLAQLPLAPLVQRMAKLDPPPQRLQSAYAWCPAIFVPALPIITTAAAAGPRPRSRQKHAAATATATEKFGTGELAVDAFVALERNSLLAVDHDPIGERLDRDREPGAGPA